MPIAKPGSMLAASSRARSPSDLPVQQCTKVELEGKNVAIEYRWGEGRNDRMPCLIVEIIDRLLTEP
jgi:hypothetical protein